MPVTGEPAERIRQIAAVQRGYIARRQLLTAGVSPSAIGRLIAASRLLPVHAGVYRVGHEAPTPWGTETAALLAARDGAALSHLSAATLWELIPAGGPSRPVDVVVEVAKTSSVPGVTAHRSRCLRQQDFTTRCGLPVTAPARTLLDAATVLGRRQLELAYDRAIVARVLGAADVANLLARTTGHPGHRRLAQLHCRQDHGTVTRSEAEERMLALIRRAQLPQPAVNARLHGFEVDFYWRPERLVVEVDGFRYHSTRRAFEHDRRRDAVLAAAGIATLRVTWRQLTEEPFAVTAWIARALASPPR